MAWTEQWSVKLDGNELNTLPDGGYQVAEVPQIEDIAEWDPVTVPVDGSHPAFIRLQPRESMWTLNVHFGACDWATYQTRKAALMAVATRGMHTLTVQVRGQSAEMSVQVVVNGYAVNPKARAASVTLFVPQPVLA